MDDESGTGSPGSGSGGSQRSCSASPDIVLLGESEEEEETGSDDEETLSQRTVSYLDIYNSDNEETHQAAVCEKAHQRDVLYAAWRDECIRQGNDDIAKCDKRVCDHTDIGKHCKAPDEIGPPLTYMEEHGVFKPAEAINNPMGLCRFYRTSSKKSNVLTGPSSADCTRNIQGMVELAKGVRQPLTVIVFEGESVTPLCLLQELHLRLTLSHIEISTPDEVKVGQKNCVSCCPICAYMAQNDNLFLNHIIVGHYWSSSSCGKCLKFVAATGQQMKRHILGCGKPQKEHMRRHSSNNQVPEARSSLRSGHESKKAKNKSDKEGIGAAGWKKPPGTPTKTSMVATSQEQAPTSYCEQGHLCLWSPPDAQES